MFSKNYSPIIFALLVMFSATGVLGQKIKSKPVNLKISVVDPGENYVADAKVTLLSLENEEIQTAATNEWGDAKLKNILPGIYRVSVTALGFQDSIHELNVDAKNDELTVRLSLEEIREEVTISQSASEKKTDRRNFSINVLTAEQIAQLPDDPEEMEQVLKNMAGAGGAAGVSILVNGFRGGKLPPKSQIREIRFRLNPFSADSHQADNFTIEIFTKPGLGDWRGGVGLAFRDESLNARNSFSALRPPEQVRRLNLDLSGTLVPKRTSLSLSANYNNSFESVGVLAALAEDSQYQTDFRHPRKALDLTARLEHAVSPSKNLSVEFQRNRNDKFNLGVGGFNLPERAFDTFQTESIARVSYSGQILKKYYNEFRAQVIWNNEKSRSKSFAESIEVLNAFSGGGSQINRKNDSLLTEIADNIDFGFGKHAMRTGVLFEFEIFGAFDESNSKGTYTFSSLEDYRNQKPALFTRRVGSSKTDFNQYKLGLYLDDDWRARKNLTISFGVRYERQSTVDDFLNFAPRLNVAWSPFESGKTVFRAGSGVFYDWLASSIYEETLRLNGSQQQELVILNPNYPNSAGGEAAKVLSPSKIQFAENLKLPVIWKNLISFEQQILPKLRLNVFYEDNRAWQQFRGRNINAPQGNNGVRLNPQFGNITQIDSGAGSVSQSVHIGLGWMNFPGFAINADYSLGREINESDSPLTLPVDSAERGFALSDRRHRLTVFGTFTLWKNLRLGTFNMAQSGAPYNITTGFDGNGDGVINDRPAGFKRNSARGDWNIVSNLKLSWSTGFGKPKNPSGGGGGQINAKTVRLGSDSDAVAPMVSQSPDGMNHRFSTEFYIQATNIFNRTNFFNYSGVRTSPFFGQPVSSLPARKLETGIRLNF